MVGLGIDYALQEYTEAPPDWKTIANYMQYSDALSKTAKICSGNRGGLLFEELELGTEYSALRHVKSVTSSASRTAARMSVQASMSEGALSKKNTLARYLTVIKEDQVVADEITLQTGWPQWRTASCLDETITTEGFCPEIVVHGTGALNDMMAPDDNIKLGILELTIHKRSRPFVQGAICVASYAHTAFSTDNFVVKAFKRDGKRRVPFIDRSSLFVMLIGVDISLLCDSSLEFQLVVGMPALGWLDDSHGHTRFGRVSIDTTQLAAAHHIAEPAAQMGGWDFYCALCGGPFGPVYWDTEGDEAKSGDYERDVLTGPEDPELAWLEDNRLIGENEDSDSLCKVWVSGPANAEMYGSMSFEPGDDPDPALYEQDSIMVYSQDYDPWSAPFHVRCREILCRYLDISVSELDKEAFFETLKAMDNGGLSHLAIDYGDISEQMEQYWATDKETEHFVFNPVQVKGLNGFLNNLPQKDPEYFAIGNTYNTDGDPFVRLPSDVLMLIMTQLDKVATVFDLRRASPAFANTDLNNAFWKDRLRNTLWLWELPPLISSHQRDPINWEFVYRKLYWGSKRFSQKKNKMYGLCNRRRIWEQICPFFAEPYLTNKIRLGEWGSVIPIVLKGASASRSRDLTLPWPILDMPSPETLLDQFVDLHAANPSLEIAWTADGRLVDIHVVNGGQSNNDRKPDESLSATIDNIPIPEGDWPTGFIFTTDRTTEPVRRQAVGLDILFAKQLPVQLGSNQGDKCLIHVKNDSFIVAITACHTPDGLLSHITLTEQALIHANGCLRVVDTLKDNFNNDYMTYLWHRQLPPPNTIMGSPPTPQPVISSVDMNPMEFLMFGTTDEELGDVTGFSADTQLGGFEVTFGHRPSRSIGPRRQVMKTLKIDGCGGERVVRIYLTRAFDVTKSICFVTNRGRYLIAGEAPKDRMALDILHNRDTLMMPCGIYGFWRNQHGLELEWRVGIFGSTTVGYVDKRKIPHLAVDEQGFIWEPSRLPTDLRETGAIWGSCGVYDGPELVCKYLPLTSCTVSWLDCRRPLVEVRVTLVHTTPEVVTVKNEVMRQAPISSISFKYVDGDVATVGPDGFPLDPTCKCKNPGLSVEELEAVPHYRCRTWHVGGKRLTVLRIWRIQTPSLGCLSAIQMVAENQIESPIWGHWGHDASRKADIEWNFAGECGDQFVGFKVFFQSIEREGTGPDYIIGGIQGLARNGSETF